MLVQSILLALTASLAASHSHGRDQQHQHDQTILAEEFKSITLDAREKWMRVAIQALHDLASPCPFSAFGAAIVNHTSSGEGELICIGVNTIADDGNGVTISASARDGGEPLAVRASYAVG